MITREQIPALMENLIDLDHCTTDKQCELCQVTDVFKGSIDIASLVIHMIINPSPDMIVKIMAIFFVMGQKSVQDLTERELLEKLFNKPTNKQEN